MEYQSPFPHDPSGTPEEEIYNARFFLKMMEHYFDLQDIEDPIFSIKAIEALHVQAMVAVQAVIDAQEGKYSTTKDKDKDK